MPLLVLSQWRFMGRHPLAALSLVVGLALGVASVVAVHLLGASLVDRLDAARPAYLQGFTHLVTRDGLTTADYLKLRSRWRQGEVPGVRRLVPFVEGTLELAGRPVRVVGVDGLALLPLPGSRSAAPVPLTGVLAASAFGWEPGERLNFTQGAVTVTGVIDTGEQAFLIADIGVAKTLLQQDVQPLAFLALEHRDAFSRWRERLDELLPGISAGLPQGGGPGLPEPWQLTPVAQASPDLQLGRAIVFNLGALGTLALLVAWFLMYQTAVLWLRQQRLVFERLLELGVAPGTLGLLFVCVLGLLALAGALLGICAGYWLANGVQKLAAGGMAVQPELLPLQPMALWKGLGSGLLVGLLAAAHAFVRARIGGKPVRRQRGWLWFPLMLIFLSVAGLEQGLLGGFALLLGVLTAALVLLTPAVSWLRRIAGRAGGSPILLAGLRQAVWYPGDLRVALAALVLALATGLALSLMVASFRADFERLLLQRLVDDLYVESPPAALAEVEHWLGSAAGVSSWVIHGSLSLRLAGGQPVAVGYARFDAGESARYGVSGALGGQSVLINEQLARRLGVDVGARLRLADAEFAVRGVFSDYGESANRVLMDVAAARTLGVPLYPNRLSIRLAEGAEVDAFSQALAARFPEVSLYRQDGIRRNALQVFDRTFVITRALSWVALFVALVGLANAQAALELDQQRVRRLLAALGLSRREAVGLSMLRGAGLGLLASLWALPLGLLLAWVLCRVINPRAFGWSIPLELSATAVAGLILGACLVAVVSGGLPHLRRDRPGSGALA